MVKFLHDKIHHTKHVKDEKEKEMRDFLDKLSKHLQKDFNNLFEIKGNDPDKFIEENKIAHSSINYTCEIIPKFNLRTLFDFNSAEWNQTTLDEKVLALKLIRDKEFKIYDTIDMYNDSLPNKNKENRIKAVSISLGKIIDHII